MPRKNQEQPDVPPFEYRAGVTVPPIGGMYRRGDPTQIPRHRLHLGVNIRLADGEAGSRPGLFQVEGTTEDACITGIFEIEDSAVAIYITQLALALLNLGIPDPSPSFTPFRIMSFNDEKVPPERNFWDEVATFAKAVPSPWRDELSGAGDFGGYPSSQEDAFNTFQPFNDTLLIANFNTVYQAEFSEDDQAPRLDLSKLFSLPDDVILPRRITSTCVSRERVDDPQTGDEFEKDVLYMGVEADASVGEVWRYDGTTIELSHSLAAGGAMQMLSWRGVGLVAAGASAGGFAYREQPGFAWVDQAWGEVFACHGLCEFNGEVVFVGESQIPPAIPGNTEARAFHWSGSGAPVLFASTPPGGAGVRQRYRTPVVAGGALHWLHLQDESGNPLVLSIARFTDFSTGDDQWQAVNEPPPFTFPLLSVGFFIPYAGAMLLLAHPAVESKQTIILVTSGVTRDFQIVYEWPGELGPGMGYEAISL